MKEKYESLSLAILKDLAKARGLKGTSALRKAQLIEVMLQQDEKDKAAKEQAEFSEKSVFSDEGQTMAVSSDAIGDAVEESQDEEPELHAAEGDLNAVQDSHSVAAGQKNGEEEGQDGRIAGRDRTGMARTEERRPRPRQTGTQDGTARTMQRRGRAPEAFSSGGRRQVTAPIQNRGAMGAASENGKRTSYDRNFHQMNSYQTEPHLTETRRTEPHQTELHPTEARQTETRQAEPRQMEDRQNEGYRPQTESRPADTEHQQTEARFVDADRPPAELSQLDSGQSVSGILEVMPDGYGFIRSANYLPGENDVYVSPSQIRRFNLKTGDIIFGNTRIKSQQEKFSALLYLKKINDLPPSEAMRRSNFEDMTPIFPNERLRLERDPRGIAMRIVDLFSPIGKGQRGMIVSPPKAGKTTLLKDIARSILRNNPEMRILILLIDERPEEVTDIKEAICGNNVEVIYSTFDETPEHHKRVSEMVIERAKRLVEQKQDVVILLDSITRLARAYNLTVPPSGRTLSGGLDPAALHMPKRFFGAARNMREGGSLTILATALVDTGSKMDDVVYEEFKGTGNMELVLDRKLSERRVFPAIDIPKSGTRREDLLLNREEQEAMFIMRKALNGMKSDDAVENIMNTFVHTRDNHELVTRVRRQKFV